jgi:predicted deacylase
MPEVEALVAETGGAWRADTIGFSQGARPLVRLSNDPGAPGSDRPGLYVLARQHSGETPGSWVLDGFLRRLAEAGDAAPMVWAVPLANIDGVEGGDYGKDNFPYDLNRAWGPAPMRHETLVLQRDARRFADRCRPVAGLDFHAPGGCQTEGVYAYVPDPETEADAAAATRPWVAAFAEALGPGLAAPKFGVVARYASRWATPGFRRFAWSELGVPALTIETPYARCGRTVLTRDVYRDVGRRLADATLARCRA